MSSRYRTLYSQPVEEKALKKPFQKPVGSPTKRRMVLGMERIADAKMTGITPLMVTLIGRNVL